jgi:hypothetical protein
MPDTELEDQSDKNAEKTAVQKVIKNGFFGEDH